ncbi:MAG: hypothetical protein ACE5FL_03525 [Myxococcota bacterium]
MKLRTSRAALVSAVFAIAMLSATGAADEPRDYSDYRLVVRMDDRSVTFTYHRLRAMTTLERVSTQGTKTKQVIPLETLLAEVTAGRDEKIVAVKISGGGRTVVLEGDNMVHVGHLWLKLGSQHASLVPNSRQASFRLRRIMGKPRFKAPESIDLVIEAKPEPEPPGPEK